MTTLTGKSMSGPMPKDLTATLATHDAAINVLGGRMTGVESSVRTLQGEVHTGFSALGSKLDKLDSRPQFDFHQTTKTVLSLAVLFSMVCAGIIYITNSQNAAERARQEIIANALAEKVGKTDSILEKIDSKLEEKVNKTEGLLEKIEQKLDWAPTVEKRSK
jgi:hypothetical protein